MILRVLFVPQDNVYIKASGFRGSSGGVCLLLLRSKCLQGDISTKRELFMP
jgi:hypothetical protein